MKNNDAIFPIELTLQIETRADSHNSALEKALEILEPLAKTE
jgi:hypothetical protein